MNDREIAVYDRQMLKKKLVELINASRDYIKDDVSEVILPELGHWLI